MFFLKNIKNLSFYVIINKKIERKINLRTHDFKNSILVGIEGENLIKRFLETHNNVISIEDVSNIRKYQDQDIDFIVRLKNSPNPVSIELKTDTYDSGNIFFETVSNKENNVPGCMYKSQANYLFYYFSKTKELYIFNFKEYVKWFEENRESFTLKIFKNINRKRNGTYTSEGYTIPKTFLEANLNPKFFKKYILT